MKEHAPIISKHTDEHGVTETRYAGWHPEKGVLDIGWQGKETVHRARRVKPVATIYVEIDWFYELYGHPIEYSIQAAQMDNELGREHKRRLEYFHYVFDVLERD